METKEKRGGYREGAGRKAVNGTRHTWTVPADIEAIAKEKGVAWLWDAVRFKVAFDKLKDA